MKNFNAEGFTLIELLATVVIGGTFIWILTLTVFNTGLKLPGYVPVKTNAIAFTERNEMRFDSCMQWDSDQEGYKTCQAFSDQTPVTLQCSYGFFDSGTCYVGQPRPQYR